MSFISLPSLVLVFSLYDCIVRRGQCNQSWWVRSRLWWTTLRGHDPWMNSLHDPVNERVDKERGAREVPLRWVGQTEDSEEGKERMMLSLLFNNLFFSLQRRVYFHYQEKTTGMQTKTSIEKRHSFPGPFIPGSLCVVTVSWATTTQWVSHSIKRRKQQ